MFTHIHAHSIVTPILPMIIWYDIPVCPYRGHKSCRQVEVSWAISSHVFTRGCNMNGALSSSKKGESASNGPQLDHGAATFVSKSKKDLRTFVNRNLDLTIT